MTMQEPGVSSLVSVRMRGAIVDDMPATITLAAVTPRKNADTVAAPA